MPKLYASPSEWYPVITPTATAGYHDPTAGQDFTDEEVADILRVQKEFNEWQRKFGERFRLSRYCVDFSLVDIERSGDLANE